MIVPTWLLYVLAAWVIAFGAYRLRVAFRKDGKDPDRSHWNQVSVFGRTKRAHAIYGVLYVVMGGMLIASALGVQMPFAAGCRSMLAGGKTSTLPAKPAEPGVELAPGGKAGQ